MWFLESVLGKKYILRKFGNFKVILLKHVLKTHIRKYDPPHFFYLLYIETKSKNTSMRYFSNIFIHMSSSHVKRIQICHKKQKKKQGREEQQQPLNQTWHQPGHCHIRWPLKFACELALHHHHFDMNYPHSYP